ncbi:MlaD family protein [Flavobacterium sp. LS1R47]|jgi:phospholipid/cholesterol/gamma-HCH transport system substrate-binding protein|uniref:MlaD family protein n=1 Tax=Flavobacterium frigoritolerans TaxID=2987686 RepID=A0A9X3C701_9FLAO|nr:MlaD family protein [Flavobacterium frigoritolerans]MCV9933044.1 MlaD family protein [Flavobacterium frigoritolerans]
MNKESGFKWKLGMFVTIGLILFMLTIYFIGKQQNLFGSTFHITSTFKTVSGLQVGNNVRFSGINIGTVEDIQLINDSSVVVKLIIKDEVRQFIKTDARASIGSEGLMGDKVLTISPGNKSNKIIANDGKIASIDAIEMDDIMKSVKKSVDNAGIISEELAVFTHNMNNGNGALSRLLTDPKLANTLTKTITNLESGTQGFSQNMEAAKSNFLFRGYFKKKEKEKEEADKKAKEEHEKLEKEKDKTKEKDKKEEAPKEKDNAKK